MGRQEQIINEIKKKVVHILKKNKVVRAGIFGSYARGDQNKDSDVDILIDVRSKGFSLLDMAKIKIELEEILKKEVDLLTYNGINPHFEKYILNDEVKII